MSGVEKNYFYEGPIDDKVPTKEELDRRISDLLIINDDLMYDLLVGDSKLSVLYWRGSNMNFNNGTPKPEEFFIRPFTIGSTLAQEIYDIRVANLTKHCINVLGREPHDDELSSIHKPPPLVIRAVFAGDCVLINTVYKYITGKEDGLYIKEFGSHSNRLPDIVHINENILSRLKELDVDFMTILAKSASLNEDDLGMLSSLDELAPKEYTPKEVTLVEVDLEDALPEERDLLKVLGVKR